MNYIPGRPPERVVFKTYARDLDLFDRDLRTHRLLTNSLPATSAGKFNQQSSTEAAGKHAGEPQAEMPALLLLHHRVRSAPRLRAWSAS